MTLTKKIIVYVRIKVKTISGIIDDQLKCFNSGIENYQKYVGWLSHSGESELPDGRFMIGMDTYPVRNGDEHIYLYTPIVNLEDPTEIPEKFPTRVLTADERREFYLKFIIITQAENSIITESEILDGIFNENSYFEVLGFHEIESNSNTKYKAHINFSCDLYNKNGALVGKIENGELRGEIWIEQ